MIQYILTLFPNPRRRRSKGHVGVVSEEAYPRSRDSFRKEIVKPKFAFGRPCSFCVVFFVEGIQAVDRNDALIKR